MSEFLPYIIIGTVAGSVYGLAATGMVLTYKTSGIFNFAHGAIATIAAYTFYSLHVLHGMSWPLAAVLSILVLGTVMGLLLERMARQLAEVSVAYKVVATVGIILVVQGFYTARYGAESKRYPAFLPTTHAFSIDGTRLSWDQIVITTVALSTTAALYLFIRCTRPGLMMRGVVDNPELLDMSGMDPVAVRRLSWMIGSVFASLAGVLLAPSLGLDALLLTLLIVQAFGAAAIGFFSNLPLAYLGGLVVGIGAAIATKYSAITHPNAIRTGLAPSIPFIVLFIVLIVTPRRRLVDRRVAARAAVASRWRAPLRLQIVGGSALGVVLVLGPTIGGSAKLPVFTDGLTKVILFLSLGLLVKTSGQVSLCHAAFAAVGAASMAHLTTTAGLPWLVALLLAGAVAIPVGAFVAIPAIRLSGVFLALATFGFAIAVQNMGYPSRILFGSSSLGVRVPRPEVGSLSSDRGYYYVVLVFVVIAAALVAAVHASRLGRLLRGLSDSPTALAAHGASINTTRVLVFCLSAFLAAVSGALYAGVVTHVTPGPFSAFDSLTWVALLAIVVGGTPWYGFVAAAALVLPGAYIESGDVGYWLTVVFGVSAVATAMTNGPTPMPALQRLLDRLGGRVPTVAGVPPRSALVVGVRPEAARVGIAPTRSAVDDAARTTGPDLLRPAVVGTDDARVPGLVVEDLEVRYGGHVAVAGVGCTAPIGRITGLIGPNGAGKTTIFNACCGAIHASAGRVVLHGEDLAGLDFAARARRGLGRTFQRMELFDSMTVEENVVLGSEASMAGAMPWKHLVGTRAEREATRRAVREAVELTDLAPLLGQPVGNLSTGERRLVELARCLAGPFDLLLLDEPSSGLTRLETERFGRVLQQVVAERNVGVLLVEHDMSLVMSVCAHIYVLDFGTLLFEGTPTDVAASQIVRSAYLGSESVPAPPTSAGVVGT